MKAPKNFGNRARESLLRSDSLPKSGNFWYFGGRIPTRLHRLTWNFAQPKSKNNTGSLPLRGILPVMKQIKQMVAIASFSGHKMHQIRFWPGLRPGPRWGSSRRSPRPPSRLGRGHRSPFPSPRRLREYTSAPNSITWRRSPLPWQTPGSYTPMHMPQLFWKLKAVC